MLLSGNGRHRRPRQAPTAMVTMAATGAIALPLLGAGGAQAAEASVWDKVAACESDGLWSSDSGNGFYGGLQITQETWEEYGGDTYADRPDMASRSQQIAVAEQILSVLGPEAWPTCGVTAGLLDDGEVPDVDPGAPIEVEATAPEIPTDEVTPSAPAPDSTSPSTKPSDNAEPPGDAMSSAGDKTSELAASQTSDTSSGASQATKAPSTGRHAKPSTSAPTTGPSGGGAGTSDGSASSADTATNAAGSAIGAYTGLLGDTLSAIVSEAAVGGWPALYESDKTALGQDAGLNVPDQVPDVGTAESASGSVADAE